MTNEEKKKLMMQGYSFARIMELEAKEKKSNSDLYSTFKRSKEKNEEETFNSLMDALRRK